MTPFFRYLDSLGHDPGRGSSEEFVEVPFVASGQISVERAFFDAEQGVYRDDLATPAAAAGEEFELALPPSRPRHSHPARHPDRCRP